MRGIAVSTRVIMPSDSQNSKTRRYGLSVAKSISKKAVPFAHDRHRLSRPAGLGYPPHFSTAVYNVYRRRESRSES